MSFTDRGCEFERAQKQINVLGTRCVPENTNGSDKANKFPLPVFVVDLKNLHAIHALSAVSEKKFGAQRTHESA